MHDRAMLRPVLETLEEISEDRRLQMNGFRVILEFASDSHCQRIIADNLDAIMVGLAWHQRPPDQALQQAGLEILLKMVDSEELDDASLGGTSGAGNQGEEATVAATRWGKKGVANGLTVGVCPCVCEERPAPMRQATSRLDTHVPTRTHACTGDVSAMSVKQMREELVALRKFEDGEATKFTLEGKDIDRINWSQFRRADLEALVLKARNHARCYVMCRS